MLNNRKAERLSLNVVFYVNNLFLPLLLPAYGMCDGGVLVEFSFDVPRYSSGLDWRPGLRSYIK
jgi:hypothetical protein